MAKRQPYLTRRDRQLLQFVARYRAATEAILRRALFGQSSKRANVHRVITPPAGIARISVPFFFGARLDASVPVLQLPPELAERVRGVTVDPLNPLFREVGRNHLKSRVRSHPDVAQRHHPDLLEEFGVVVPA